MPRLPRLDVADVAQHVIQRGNDRRPCFFAAIDRVRYLADLREIALREGCRVHAYVLMTNHVHLLITPDAAGRIARVMQALGRRYVRYVNDRYHRTGTLWEGRYKSCPVDGSTHLLRCHRYIELNPLRAAMVADPTDYPWSSFHGNALGRPDPLLQPHRAYLALSDDATLRRAAYRALLAESIDTAELDAIRHHVQRQHAYGSARFRAAIEARLGRRAGPGRMGRPRKDTRGEPAESAL